MSNYDLTKNNKGSNKGDLISRSALIKWIDDSITQFKYYLINNAPTVVNENLTSERPQGKWLDIYASHIAYECSNCHMQMPINGYFNFCPNCGAEMQREVQNE